MCNVTSTRMQSSDLLLVDDELFLQDSLKPTTAKVIFDLRSLFHLKLFVLTCKHSKEQQRCGVACQCPKDLLSELPSISPSPFPCSPAGSPLPVLLLPGNQAALPAVGAQGVRSNPAVSPVSGRN